MTEPCPKCDDAGYTVEPGRGEYEMDLRLPCACTRRPEPKLEPEHTLLEDALRLSSDWIAIKEAALLQLRAEAYAELDGETHAMHMRRLALVEAWPPGSPPRHPCNDLIVMSTPQEVDGLQWHIVEVDEIRRDGTRNTVFGRSRRNPHTVVIRATKGTTL